MSKPSLLIWGGPVFADTPSKVQWQSPVDIIAVTGNGSSYFGQLADQYRGADGRILRNLVAAHGKKLDDYGKVALAGFSAFHGLANAVLDSDSDLVDAMVSIDSCFSAIGSPAKKGYLKFASKAGRGSGLLVMTIGPGGGVGSGATLGPGGEDFSSAIDCVMASTASAGHFSKESVEGDLPQPDSGSALVSGGVVLLDYRRFRHDQHIHYLAIPVMDAYLAPFLAQTISPFMVNMAAAAVGAVAAFLLYDTVVEYLS
jgi:hypothetical protein